MYRFFFNLVKEGTGRGETTAEGASFFFPSGNGNITSKLESYKFLCILGSVLEVWGNFDSSKNYHRCRYWRLSGTMYFFRSSSWSFRTSHIHNWPVIDLLTLSPGWASYCGTLRSTHFDLNSIWHICSRFSAYYQVLHTSKTLIWQYVICKWTAVDQQME